MFFQLPESRKFAFTVRSSLMLPCKYRYHVPGRVLAQWPTPELGGNLEVLA